MSKNIFKQFQCDHMIQINSTPSQSLLPSPLKQNDFESPNETLNVCEQILHHFHIYGIN